MNRFEKKGLGFLALVGLVSLLSACGSSPKNWQESNVVKSNKIDLVRLTHDIDFGTDLTDAKALPEATAQALDAFLDKSNVGHYDELSIDLPLTKDGDITKSDLKHRNLLAAHLKARGLKLATTLTPYGAEPQAGTIRLVVGRYVVTPPKCSDWSKPSGHDYQNTVGSNYGCSTESALGQMVANPHDLIEGAPLSPASGAAGAKAVQTYYESSSSVSTTSSGAAAPADAAAGSATTGN